MIKVKAKDRKGKTHTVQLSSRGLAFDMTLGKLYISIISRMRGLGYCALNSVFPFFRTNDGENSTR